MSDPILSDLLDRSVENVPTTDLPVAELLGRGRAIRRRRRRTAIAGVIAAGLIVVGAIAAGQHSTPRVPPPTNQLANRPTGLLAAPVGMKWVGVERTVVAVPQGWPVLPGVYCPEPIRPYVTIRQWRVAVGCTPTRQAETGRQRPAVIDIEGDAASGFVAHIQGSGGLTQRSLDASRTTLPRGWLAVPSGEPYGGAGPPTLSSEIAALSAAGFHVVRKHTTPAGRWKRVTTEPEIGTPARLGSTVVVYDHGAVASSATMRGRLDWVGGPALGSPVPHPGTIHVVNADDSIDQTVQADADGAWEISVPPGTYAVRATSPGYGSTRDGTVDGCVAARGRVTVHADETLTVNVHCPLR